jgi:protein-disulfide isomerase
MKYNEPALPQVTKKDHSAGNPDARVVLIEYGDYQCPTCKQAFFHIKRLLQQMNQQVLFVFRNFPLDDIHPMATPAALAAEAAGDQGKFWAMNALLYENQDALSEQNLNTFCESLHLDTEKFDSDRRSKALRSKVEDDFKGGLARNVKGTPTFFVNRAMVTTYDGTYESLLKAVSDRMNRVQPSRILL